MFAQERRSEILKILMNKTKVRVKELSLNFDVSEVIIRKDLKLLEEEGKLERTHGGAILKKEIPVDISLNHRKVVNLGGKKKITNKLYKIIEDGEIVFLDSSSTNLLLAEKLAESPKKITVVTNMLDIMKCLDGVDKIELIGIGGTYHSVLGIFLGGLALDSVLKINTQKLFLGGTGIDVQKGNISIIDSNEATLKKAMIQMASKVYFVCEKDKFHSYGIYNFGTIDDLDAVVVDEKPEKQFEEKLRENGVEII
ncbi:MULTISPECIES: DeoR/GlpR family DNA-binding transcription regulator [Psychrilyobacter]|uniref:DeoR family transcriptional regulator n=1 Tax=Psychrilyobacter piezotolerans TaxID=2293438 RepID=A0ABX9KJR8_9FUSO|nr:MULTISPECIES: DeoR/GlpR family DNA-binding transcription regulator [Psychrilyobacter]MCS5421753.1 DeoR/GlpR family DNA-binding transcription regulator [Psychrilyobacter sp. S5]NDI77058.1 DeoR/GlpR transcriptional regulator [Psychrilyobacter piezotolerans]RDE64674.1 DeoR/GlpR transcriptional regulator [Psychrilyobacter sp. S5]REI42486.1 DeoR family transcriptional regulator [Psychrilyobacter piezotolerans]